jgi:hypothetical protein
VPSISPQSRTVSIRPALTSTSVPGERAAFAGGESKPGDAGDARERFAAEAEGLDRREIGARANFARGVALEAEERIVAVHAHAVVDHPEARAPARADGDLDPGGAGIERILHQLLHHAGRALDDFARGHLAGDVFGQ